MSLLKYRIRDVASDFGVAPKEIVEIISKFFEKPKSNTQVLTEEELAVRLGGAAVDPVEFPHAVQCQKVPTDGALGRVQLLGQFGDRDSTVLLQLTKDGFVALLGQH